MRISALLCLLAAACAARFRNEHVLSTSLPARPAPELARAELPVAPGSTYVLHYRASLPRAVKVSWRAACAGAEELSGTLGETFDDYRQRRLRALEAERRRKAALVGSLVSTVAPRVDASASVSGPGGGAAVEAGVDPGAAAAASALASMPPPELAPGDVGSRVERGKVTLYAGGEGGCVVSFAADPPGQDTGGVVVDLALDRQVDLEAEAELARQAHEAEGLRVREELRARLVASERRRPPVVAEPVVIEVPRPVVVEAPPPPPPPRPVVVVHAPPLPDPGEVRRLDLVRLGWDIRFALVTRLRLLGPHASLGICLGGAYQGAARQAAETLELYWSIELRAWLVRRLVVAGADPTTHLAQRLAREEEARVKLALVVRDDVRTRLHAWGAVDVHVAPPPPPEPPAAVAATATATVPAPPPTQTTVIVGPPVIQIPDWLQVTVEIPAPPPPPRVRVKVRVP